MATLDTLVENESLVKIEVDLDVGVLPWRCLYGTPEFITWLDQILPNIVTTVVGGDIEPEEQVDAIFNEFVSGKAMSFDRRFKKLSATPETYVWEFKTLDIRIFGWVPKCDHFICTFGDMKDTIEVYRRYGRYVAQTIYFRTNLDLDEPKFIASEEYANVLSDAP